MGWWGGVCWGCEGVLRGENGGGEGGGGEMGAGSGTRSGSV